MSAQQTQWHIAFCNVTYTEYASVTYKDYYGSPAVMLAAQLRAREHAERCWGAGGFIQPCVDAPYAAFVTTFGMSLIEPQEDEVPYLDTSRPIVTEPADIDQIQIEGAATAGYMATQYEFWRYYRDQGYDVDYAYAEGAAIETAMEISGNRVLEWMLECPHEARRLIDKVLEATECVAAHNVSLRGKPWHGLTYTGDDFSGLLSPKLYRAFAVPAYLRLYGNNDRRFMHSELLGAEHLRIARDEVDITEFHGAGCVNLTLAQLHEIMGTRFWTQLTPQEMLELSPMEISEKVKAFAGSGCAYVQIYPGRGTPVRNMDAAVSSCQRECLGGPSYARIE